MLVVERLPGDSGMQSSKMLSPSSPVTAYRVSGQPKRFTAFVMMQYSFAGVR